MSKQEGKLEPLKPLAVVGFTCGRHYLDVAGIAVAMEGDMCRQLLPSDVAEPIPEDELKLATIGGKPCSELPLDLVRTFRGERWTPKSLQWAAGTINQVAREQNFI